MSAAVEDTRAGELRPTVVVTALVATAVVLVAMILLPWFTVAGPDVVRDAADVPTNGRTTYVVAEDIGTQHSPVIWTLVVIALGAMFGTASTLPRVAWACRLIGPMAAGAVIVSEAQRTMVALSYGFMSSGGEVDVSIAPGIFVAVGGLAAVAVASTIGLRRPP